MFFKKLFVVGSALFVLASCAVTPEPITDEEIKQRIAQDQEAMFKEQAPITKPVTLQEALARALKYNLDHRVKLMEIALSQRILTTYNYEMLPELMLSAGYHSRSNDSGGISRSLLTGDISLEPSTSVERDYSQAGLNVVWNVLDFGVSYATAQQHANDVLIAKERSRRVLQNILLDTVDAYWRAVGSERLLTPVNELLGKTREALKNSREMAEKSIQNPEVSLLYQKRLLEALNKLNQLRERLELSKTQLAALMNLRPGTYYEVEVPKTYHIPDGSELDLAKLENEALSFQPELLEEDYKTRNKALEVKKAIRRMYPGLEISFGPNVNSNSYLYNGDWFEAGLRLSWNVLNLFTGGPAQKAEAEAHVVLAEHRRMALSMAVMTQLWISYNRFQLAKESFAMADELYQVNKQLSQFMINAQKARMRSELDTVLTQTDAIVSKAARELSFADVQIAWLKIFHSVGTRVVSADMMDLTGGNFHMYSLEDIQKQFADTPLLKQLLSVE